MKDLTYPAWFNGPDGKSAIFASASDVPTGWTSGAEKISVSGKAPLKTDEPHAKKEHKKSDLDL